ncbi:MAG: NAD-dependent epimerase/dehydratase family protein [Gammaproteobacteria bacterium]
MIKVFVTGGAGFIGSHTVDLLLEKNFRVIVYDNFSTGKLTNLNLFHPHIEVVQGDILDYPKLVKEMARCDAVLHLAALASVPKSIENPIESLKVNTMGFLYVLQAIREINKPLRLVYASSAAVYGDTEDLPCRDDVTLATQALSPYALEKATDERYAALYTHLFNIKSLGLRYFNVYGERQDPKSPYSGVIAKFIANYKAKEPIKIFGDGEQSRDFIFVGDVARANVLALQSEYCGVLNIATGTPETLKNMVQYIEKVGGEPAQIEYAQARSGDIPRSFACTEKADRYLNFQYTTTLEQGMGLLIRGL